ncbi:hypothetical protein [Plantactinospora sp. GCM10030261]
MTGTGQAAEELARTPEPVPPTERSAADGEPRVRQLPPVEEP